MKRKLDLRFQFAAVTVLAMFAFVGLSRIWHRENRVDSLGWDSNKHHIRLTMIAQEGAVPGKVIRAELDGREVSKYICTEDDAAVALYVATDSAGDGFGRLEIPTAEDSAGHSFPTLIQNNGNTFFVRILKGFPSTPKSVKVQANYYAATDPSDRPAAHLVTSFTRFAPAKRMFSASTGSDLRRIERLAYAEFAERPRVLTIKTGSPHSIRPTILATGYSGRELPRDLIPQRIRSAYTEYDDRTDAVKVRLDCFDEKAIETTLVYRDAEIVEMNGKRILWFPTTQTVGTINGCPATIRQFTQSTMDQFEPKHSLGVVTIHLGAQSPGSFPISQGDLKCLEISPSVQSLGVDWVTVGVDRYGYSDVVKQTGAGKGFHVSKIKELRLKFQIKQNRPVTSTTVVLPVHRVKYDAELVQPAMSDLALSHRSFRAIPRPGHTFHWSNIRGS